MKKNFTSYFENNFYKKLLSPAGNNPVRNRADSLKIVFETLESKKQFGQEYFKIIETGTTRADHGHLCYGDDGCSTYIFDKFINFYDGEVLSVDINQNNCDFSKTLVSDKTKIFCSDSVKFLWDIPSDYKIDLLYLDSFDIEKDNAHPSQLHHIKELCAVTKNLKSGSIVVVDDHDAFFTNGRIGKANYVKDFMNSIGAKLLFEQYQIGWEL